VVYARDERHLWGLERVIWGELDGEEEHSALVRALLWTHDGRLPFEHIFFVNRSRRALRGWVTAQILEFFCYPFQGHVGGCLDRVVGSVWWFGCDTSRLS